MKLHKNNKTSIPLFHYSFFSHAPTTRIKLLVQDNYIPPLFSHSHSSPSILSLSLSILPSIYYITSTNYLRSIHHQIDMELALDSRKLQLQPQNLNQEQQLQKQQHFHVLAVDDSVIDRMLLERLLRDSSCKVTCVDSGDKALKYLGLNIDELDNNSSSTKSSTSTLESSSPPLPQPLQLQEGSKVNLIMTDYCMPGMSGYDLLKRVKVKISSFARHLP